MIYTLLRDAILHVKPPPYLDAAEEQQTGPSYREFPRAQGTPAYFAMVNPAPYLDAEGHAGLAVGVGLGGYMINVVLLLYDIQAQK